MMARFKRVLFFLAGSVPTEDELAEAEKLGPGVLFRNASFIRDDDAIENADAVAGAVPKRYREAYSAKGREKYANDLARGRKPGTEAGTGDGWGTTPTVTDGEGNGGADTQPNPADAKGKGKK